MPSSPEDYPSAFYSHMRVGIGNRTSRAFDRLPLLDRARPVFFRHFISSFFLLVVIFVSGLVAAAQSPSATLTGTVIDQNDAVIPGVNIAVISIAQGFQRVAVTDGDGLYVVPLLPPGNYTVKAEREGFATAEIRNVVLNINDRVTLRVQLRVGDVTQNVVVADRPALIDESPAVGTTVDRHFVENLALNGRSFQPLIGLTPGVVATKTSASEQGQFSVNGQRASANYFTVDGVSANAGVSAGFALVQSGSGALPALSAAGGTNSLVSVDAMQEFKVQTSTFAPEFGRTPGAQVQIVTRSGTNQFHGTIFEYFRNDALDANDWFANSRRQKRPALRQNDFGAVIGGPLYLPNFGEGGRTLYSGKNRTFFFFSYEGLRLRLPQSPVTTVPSLISRQQAVPQMRPFLNAFPIPNGAVFANGSAEFAASYSDPLNLDATSIRVDHAFNDKLILFGRYNHSPSETTLRGSSSSLNSLSNSRYKTQTLTIGATQSFTPTVSNEIRANYSRNVAVTSFSIDDFGGAVPPADSLFFPSFTKPQESLFFFQISGAGVFATGKNVGNLQRQINLIDNLSLLTGKHQLRFGIDYRLLLPVNGPRSYQQTVSFSNLTTAKSGVAALVSVGARDTVALSFTNFSAYGQDTWKPTRRLTLTYGLRWEVNPAPKARNNKELFTFENLENPPEITLAPPGTPLYKTTLNNIAPRIGVAYQLSQQTGRETILRGGFGVFYDLGSGSLSTASSGFPYSRAKNSFGVPFPLNPDQLLPPLFSLNIPTSGTAFIADRNLELPRTYQWNVAVEQSLGSNQTITATYLAAIGRRLLRSISISRPPSFTINLTENSATSDYQAMQLQFERRLSGSLQVLSSYTWSHSIDIASNDSVSDGTPRDPKLDRGSSNFDVRHAFNAAVSYKLPAPPRGTVANAFLDNWSVDTIVTARSATPVDLTGAFNFISGVQAAVRPDLIVGVPLYVDDPNVPGGRRFNRAAFVAPPAGREGTLGRNILRGFAVWQVDLSLRRQFNLTERWKLQLKADAFNVFNHPNFGDPTSFLGSALFGQSTVMFGRGLGSGGASGGFNPLYQIGGPRSIQLGLKLAF